MAAGLLLVAIIIGLHLPRAFLTLPLYAGDEGAYLIHALFGGLLKTDPGLYPALPDVDNTAFFWIVRLVDALPGDPLDALRLLGGAAYVGGLVLVWRGVRPQLAGRDAAGVLLLGLAFPYYRFVFTALPEGWYVGLLGLIIYLTARFYRTRPWAHAAGLGALTACLVLIKPHGVALAAGFVALVVIDTALDAHRKLLASAGRLALFATTFLLAGHAVQMIDGHGPPTGLWFVGSGFYGAILKVTPSAHAIHIGVVALFGMATGSLLLAGAPVALGLDDLAARWRAERGRFRLEAADLAFLLTLMGYGATVAMVAIFAAKVADIAPMESYRLWGRYFEFFVPLIWLTAWPYVRASEHRPDRQILAAGVVLAGLIGLVVALKSGVSLLPWDATALSAFYIPGDPRWPLFTTFPGFALACAATLGVIILTLRKAPALQVWQGYFAVLACLSFGLDQAWWSQISPERDILQADLKMVGRAMTGSGGETATFVDDPNAASNVFLRLRGRTHIVMMAPGASPSSTNLKPYQTLVVEKGVGAPAPTWRIVQAGKQLTVYQRGSLDTPIR
ncbi:ArnT family glycosyltransferase [Phenylobacterium aquaticum]|uniref:ArnT family glycosyltransferase n=1 Tax=Phenylobacterium aquaticum TaxID=1763816 RepID=UPI001F5CD701|nr:glycosyltransferase family 39 protein [Phenylobacterium aquaticum]MCI3134561.1 glycosyltransferase family 39 protein [Phenylobacterium aquaticum]